MKEKPLQKDQRASRHQVVCPWWFCFSFDNIFRKCFQNPERILEPYVKPGWTVIDIGPGMGYFTIPLARLVGDAGKVIAVDLQPKMLEGIQRRAFRAGVEKRIQLHQNTADSLGLSEPVDFCLAFWMLHEVPNRHKILGEIAACLKKNGLLLIVEPKWHVSRLSFSETLRAATDSGLKLKEQPKVFLSYTALLTR